jgi:hypothetical protein
MMPRPPLNATKAEAFEAGPRWNDTSARGWRDRARGAFEIDVLMPDKDGVTLDYRRYDGVPVRTHFRFTSTGKISLTACAPIRAAA